jgi:hypothetical protein
MSTYLSLSSLLMVMTVLAAVYFCYERRRAAPAEIAAVATLAALAGLGRVPFAAVPGVQPTTFLVLVCSQVFGPLAGFIIGSTAAFVSNFFLAFSGKDTFPLAFYLCGFFLGVYFWMDPQLLALVDFCLSADPPFFSGHYGDRNRFRFYACPLQRFFYDVSGSGSGHYFAALQTKAFFLFPA